MKEYAGVDPEENPSEYDKEGAYSDDPHAASLPKSWPRSGEIEFRDVTVKYDPEGPEILKNINLRFEAGQRVAVVGRTGSGKSTVSGPLVCFVSFAKKIYSFRSRWTRWRMTSV